MSKVMWLPWMTSHRNSGFCLGFSYWKDLFGGWFRS